MIWTGCNTVCLVLLIHLIKVKQQLLRSSAQGNCGCDIPRVPFARPLCTRVGTQWIGTGYGDIQAKMPKTFLYSLHTPLLCTLFVYPLHVLPMHPFWDTFQWVGWDMGILAEMLTLVYLLRAPHGKPPCIPPVHTCLLGCNRTEMGRAWNILEEMPCTKMYFGLSHTLLLSKQDIAQPDPVS